jgi:hypothetical protein
MSPRHTTHIHTCTHMNHLNNILSYSNKEWSILLNLRKGHSAMSLPSATANLLESSNELHWGSNDSGLMSLRGKAWHQRYLQTYSSYLQPELIVPFILSNPKQLSHLESACTSIKLTLWERMGKQISNRLYLCQILSVSA